MGSFYHSGTQRLQFQLSAGAEYRVDELRVVDGDLRSTYTMTYNYANELTQVSNSAQGTSMSFTYDAWGRTATKAMGGKSAQYGYRYGSKLYSVDSNIPGEGSATYETGGDQKLRMRTQGAESVVYRWDGKYNVINEVDDQGVLQKTYFHHPKNWTGVGSVLADVAGSNPASGNYRYYSQDHLGSTRRLYAHNKSVLSEMAYTPYGELYHRSGEHSPRMFTGQIWDAALGQYYFPMRHYSPALGRWTTREPSGLDGPNMYHYTFGNPVMLVDVRGESVTLVGAIGIGIAVAVIGGIICWVGGCTPSLDKFPGRETAIINGIIRSITGRGALPPGANPFIRSADPEVARFGLIMDINQSNITGLSSGDPDCPIPNSPNDRVFGY